MARLERRDLRNKRHPRSGDASEKKHLGMTTLLCGATFEGLESARQTAPTKRKVYEDFTTTLMRRRENRVWSSYRKRRREPSWGKKTTRVGKETPMKGISTALFALLCLSITQDRVLRSGPYARRFGRGHRRFRVRREQRRRNKLGEFGKHAKSARRERDFRYKDILRKLHDENAMPVPRLRRANARPPAVDRLRMSRRTPKFRRVWRCAGGASRRLRACFWSRGDRAW